VNCSFKFVRYLCVTTLVKVCLLFSLLKQAEIKAEEKAAVEPKQEEPAAVAPVIEEVGVVEEQPAVEPEVIPAQETPVQVRCEM